MWAPLLRRLVLFASVGGFAVSCSSQKQNNPSQSAGGDVTTRSDIDYAVPPDRIGAGVVRVWNAAALPRAGRDSIQEARIGQSLIVEIKDLEGWLAKQIDDRGLAELELTKLDADLQNVIKAKHFHATMRVGPWLAAHRPISVTAKDGQMLGEDAIKLCADLKEAMSAQNDAPGDAPLPGQWEAFAAYNGAQPEGARKMLASCEKAWTFARSRAEAKAGELRLRITLQKETMEKETMEKETMEKEPIELPAGKLVPDAKTDRTSNGELYRKISFVIESQRLTDALQKEFSLRASVTVALPDGGKSMETSVKPSAPDPRCRFDLLAAVAPKTEEEMVFSKEQLVYPVDELELGRKIKKGEVVKVLPKTDKPYLVHFQVGGTKLYNGSELRRLPPDPVPIGVVRVWNERDPKKLAESGQSMEVPKAAPGERLFVEVRNFDGWLLRQLDLGYFREEASPKALETVQQFLAHKQFSAAVRADQWFRERRGKVEGISNAKLVEEFKAAARKDQKLESLLAEGLLVSADVSEDNARKFVAACHEAHDLLGDLLKAKMREVDLNINGVALGLIPDNASFSAIGAQRRPPGDPNEDTYNWFSFHLLARPEKVDPTTGKLTDEPWKQLLARPTFRMPSRVTLSLRSGGDMVVMPTAVTKDAEDPRCQFDLIGIDAGRFVAMVVVVVMILGSLGYFAMRTDMLRDPTQRCPDGLEPVSLARTQMAFWFVVIALAFAFLWMVTERIGTINGTCLTLLGIGTTTALSSVAIERSRQQRCRTLGEVFDRKTHEMLQLPVLDFEQMIHERQKKLAAEVAAAPAGSPERDELEQTGQLLGDEAKKLETFRSRWGWFARPWLINFTYRFHLGLKDLLSENPGTSAYDFHRFQMLAWTLVLGFVFVAKVLSERTMPEFDGNLLLLMGISSGAYLGLKMATPRPAADKPKVEEPNVEEPKEVEPKEPESPAAEPAPPSKRARK